MITASAAEFGYEPEARNGPLPISHGSLTISEPDRVASAVNRFPDP